VLRTSGSSHVVHAEAFRPLNADGPCRSAARPTQAGGILSCSEPKMVTLMLSTNVIASVLGACKGFRPLNADGDAAAQRPYLR
jgi:hypothetical protein